MAGGQHPTGLQQLQHDVAPVIEQRQRADDPAPASTAGRAGSAESRGRAPVRAGVGLSGFTQRRSNSHALDEQAEQRAPIGAGDALFQVLDVADEDRDRCAPCSVMTWNWSVPAHRARGQAGENSWTAVSRAQMERKTRLPFLVTDAAVSHQVRAFVNTIQRLAWKDGWQAWCGPQKIRSSSTARRGQSTADDVEKRRNELSEEERPARRNAAVMRRSWLPGHVVGIADGQWT